MSNSPKKLYELAANAVNPVEFVSWMKGVAFPEKIKLTFFKRIVTAMYLSVPHYKVLGLRLNSVFDEPKHECNMECADSIVEHVRMMKKILDSTDFALFLFVVDKFCEQGLLTETQSPFRYEASRQLHRLGHTRDPHTWDRTNDTWWQRINSVFEDEVGSFKPEPGSFNCFPECVNRQDWLQRTHAAKNDVASLACLLPDNESTSFLVYHL